MLVKVNQDVICYNVGLSIMLTKSLKIYSQLIRNIQLYNFIVSQRQNILTNNLKIKPLEFILEERANHHVKRLFQNHQYPRIFEFGIHPMQFRLNLLIYLKYGYWQTDALMFQKLKQFISNCTETIANLTHKQSSTQIVLQEGDKQKKELILQYRHFISIELVPGFIYESQYCNIYLQQLVLYLEEMKKMRRQLQDIDIYCILKNIEKILFKHQKSQYFNNQNDNAWLISHAFNLFLFFYLDKVNDLPTNYKSIVVLIAKTLRVNHLPFLEYIKKDLQKQKRDINLQYFIATFTYLSLQNSFPYEYFYKVKDDLMNFIESAQDLSEKKVTVALYMLQIFSRRQLVFCQKIISRLIKCLKNNLIACDITQITRIFYHYSRLRYSPDKQFIFKLVQRITLFMDVLDEKHYALIIRSITNLNYQNQAFLQKLKEYNYQLFLTQLKYGCERLGDYYKAILNEVQANFYERSLKNTNNSNSQQEKVKGEKDIQKVGEFKQQSLQFQNGNLQKSYQRT